MEHSGLAKSRISRSGALWILRADLSADAYQVILDGGEANAPQLRESSTLSGLFARWLSDDVVYREDISAFRAYTALDYLRTFLGESREQHCLNFRRKTADGFRWTVLEAHPTEAGGSDVYLVLRDIRASDEAQSSESSIRNTVLIVSPCAEMAERLRAMVQEAYPVLTADSADLAAALLLRQSESVAVILADQQLPEMADGAFFRTVDNAAVYATPVIVFGGRAEEADRLIGMGAADFLDSPYQAAVIRNRIRFMIRYQELSNTRQLPERDPVTDLCARDHFLRSAEQLLRQEEDALYAVLVSDVEHYHFYKERHGRETAERMLKNLAHIASDLLSGCVLSGRIGEDVFAYLVRYSPDIEQSVASILRSFAAVSSEISNTTISVKYGMYIAHEDIPVSAMCDRALVASKSIQGQYGVDLAEFNAALRQNLLNTQQIIENAEGSLDKEQFVVYYQPKHDIQHGGVGGAEAVIRWMHPTMGFMNPVSFIPLFEKNGFIEVLDEFVLHRVCKDILEWKKKGERILPVSVNVSRVDFDKDGLAKRIIRTVDSYGLDHSLIHVEITESGYAEDPDKITRELTRLHEAGFVIELDDFGTGYSFLSALNALPVDILKLDMSLLHQDNAVSNRNILEFSMRLAKIMKLATVQEGVETREQLEQVFSLGCDQVQGFYFSKPLPKEQYMDYCRKMNAQ